MFKIQKNLLESAVKAVSGALEVTNDPNSPGQYVLLRAVGADSDGGILHLTVANHDVVSRLIIDKADPALLSVDKPAAIAVTGSKLSILSTYKSADSMVVNLKQAANAKPVAEGSSVMDLGKLEFKIKGAKKEEGFNVQCVDIDITPKIDETGDLTATVSGSDLIKFGKAVGISAGKASHRSEYSNVLIKASDKKVTLVTVTQQQLSEANLTRIDQGSDFNAVVPYDLFVKVLSVVNQSQNVTIRYNTPEAGKTGTVVFAQDFVFGGADKAIGELKIRVTCAADKFPKYEKIVEKIDFGAYWATVNTQRFKEITDRFASSFSDNVRTKVTLNPDAGVIEFVKDGENSIESHIDIVESTKMPLELILSARHMKLAIDLAENEITKIYFSGPVSLAKFQCTDTGFIAYAVPFKDATT